MARKNNKTAEVAAELSFTQAPAPETLRIIPLGGLGEFGKNMMAFEYGEDIIIVDCGQMFPEDDMPGVDSVIPDFTYVHERRKRIRALVLTHGHEDHIGATPYFLRDFTEVPVYGSRLTLALVHEKLREMGIADKVEMYEIHGRSVARLGAFEVEFLQVSHSIPEAMALAIRLPIGTIFHTGDYKFDSSGDAEVSDFYTLSSYGEKGVLALIADSTNVDREGYSPSEKSAIDALRPLISGATEAVVVSTFSSSLARVQGILNIAQQIGRKVGLAGFSLDRNFGIATRLGLLHYPEDLVVSLKDLSKLPPEQRILICTGCQGEPLAALSRMALDDYKNYHIHSGDTIILSSRIIPGNEKAIYRTINHLYRRGARVITEKDAPIHASGHAYRDEMRQLYRMLRPRYIIPMHGELRQLMEQRDLAIGMGYDPASVFVIENGDALDMTPRSCEHYHAGLSGQVMVDGKIMDALDEVVLRDRKHLSEDGMILIVLVIDRQELKIIAGPDIVTRGFVEVDSNADLIEACKDVVIDAFEGCRRESREEWEVVKSAVRRALRKFLRDETDRYPLILPMVIEI